MHPGRARASTWTIEHRMQHGPAISGLLFNVLSEHFIVTQPAFAPKLEGFSEDGSIITQTFLELLGAFFGDNGDIDE